MPAQRRSRRDAEYVNVLVGASEVENRSTISSTAPACKYWSPLAIGPSPPAPPE
jgi:hypothetical protein